MKLHHTKHHATYVQNLNVLEEKLAEAMHKKDTSAIIGLQNNLKFNGGGHLNHSIFWKNMCPAGGGDPSGELLELINKNFTSVDTLRNELSQLAITVQGSGWAWLGYSKKQGKICLATTQNQDPLEPTHDLVPLMGIDVWEHAYYLQYKNARADYVKSIWKVVNWKDVAERLENVRKK